MKPFSATPARRIVALTSVAGAVALVGIPAALARSSIDRTRLPIGKTSTSPQRDRLYACQTTFPSSAAGAQTTGPWFNGDGTWDMTKKYTVDGSVNWPNANLTITVSGDRRVITGNALPVSSTTGVFPVGATDDAYRIDRNPNSITAQSVSLSLPANPTVNATAQCVGGEVGISLDGPPIFNAVDAGGRDAVAYEVQDRCSGHPQQSGVYHYHSASASADRTAQFGWALDGFPIMGAIDPATGEELTNDDLDECHGRTATITLDGKQVTTYHYVANDQYPYTVGCFRGTASARSSIGGAAGPPTGATRPSTSAPSTSAPSTSAPRAGTAAGAGGPGAVAAGPSGRRISRPVRPPAGSGPLPPPLAPR